MARRINRVAPGAIELVDAGGGRYHLDFNLMNKANGGGYKVSDPNNVLGKVFEKIEVTKPFTFTSTTDVALGASLDINGFIIPTTVSQSLDDLTVAINSVSNDTGVALASNPSNGKYYFTDGGTGKNYLIFKSINVENQGLINCAIASVFKQGNETIERPTLTQDNFVYNTSGIVKVRYEVTEGDPATLKTTAASIKLSDPANLQSSNNRVVVYNTDASSAMKFSNLEIGYDYHPANHAVNPVSRHDNKGVEVIIGAGMASLLSNNLMTYTEDAGTNKDPFIVNSVRSRIDESKAEMNELIGQKRVNDIEEQKYKAKVNSEIAETATVYQKNMAMKNLSKAMEKGFGE